MMDEAVWVIPVDERDHRPRPAAPRQTPADLAHAGSPIERFIRPLER